MTNAYHQIHCTKLKANLSRWLLTITHVGRDTSHNTCCIILPYVETQHAHTVKKQSYSNSAKFSSGMMKTYQHQRPANKHNVQNCTCLSSGYRNIPHAYATMNAWYGGQSLVRDYKESY